MIKVNDKYSEAKNGWKLGLRHQRVARTGNILAKFLMKIQSDNKVWCYFADGKEM